MGINVNCAFTLVKGSPLKSRYIPSQGTAEGPAEGLPAKLKEGEKEVFLEDREGK